jgi:thiol-disulfide isomerase/thioredoxin
MNPKFLEPNYQFKPIADKVVVDLFWNTFCETSNIEAQRVREVVTEFRDLVVLHEYCADNQTTLFRYQTPRGIFINGKEIFWGYEAPKEGIRGAISQALRNR